MIITIEQDREENLQELNLKIKSICQTDNILNVFDKDIKQRYFMSSLHKDIKWVVLRVFSNSPFLSDVENFKKEMKRLLLIGVDKKGKESIEIKRPNILIVKQKDHYKYELPELSLRDMVRSLQEQHKYEDDNISIVVDIFGKLDEYSRINVYLIDGEERMKILNYSSKFDKFFEDRTKGGVVGFIYEKVKGWYDKETEYRRSLYEAIKEAKSLRQERLDKLMSKF